jgi:hypothetical protein
VIQFRILDFGPPWCDGLYNMRVSRPLYNCGALYVIIINQVWARDCGIVYICNDVSEFPVLVNSEFRIPKSEFKITMIYMAQDQR